jgi:tetratricopeptide (TPR) repeat protein
VPTGLTADTDMAAVAGVFEDGAWLGFVFVIGVVVAAVWCSIRRDWRPAAFGLWWFLLAQIPTAIFPLAEVENDHRMYFPFAGLVLAVCWSIAQWSRPLAAARPVLKIAAAAAGVLVIAGAVIATRQRNEVWRTEESLWLDVTQKSPKNGRGLMNYGVTQMEKGDYQTAIEYYNRAAKFTPAYFTLEINHGIASGAINDTVEAERHFRRALDLRPDSADSHFFYGRWLRQVNRVPEAVARLERAVAINPEHISARSLLTQISQEPGAGVVGPPRTPEEFLNLSLAHHRAGRYLEAIATAEEALKRRPDYAEAYNNIAAAFEDLHEWDLAIEAAHKALAIRPDFELARNNLAWAQSQKKAQEKK